MIILKIIMDWRKAYLSLVLLIFFLVYCYPQSEQIRFKRITNKDGLSQNWIRCIYQDETGYMWFGTSGGLNRYDGYDFKLYNLGGVNVNAILKKMIPSYGYAMI